MRLTELDIRSLTRLSHVLDERQLFYGGNETFGSPLTTAQVVITPSEADELIIDALSIETMAKTVNDIYLESVGGQAPDWIASWTEYGLAPGQWRAHRRAAQLGLRPMMGRIDYITLGPTRQIAEVQWKSGGPGLFIGIADAYASVLDHTRQQMTAPADTFLEAASVLGLGAVVNVVSDRWLRSEQFLHQRAREMGMIYVALDRRDIDDRIRHDGAGVFQVRLGRGWAPVGVIFGRLPRAAVELLALGQRPSTWLEGCANELYRQKWTLSLPFDPDFADRFDDRVRSIVAPTARLGPFGRLDLRAVAEALPPDHAARLGEVRHLAELAKLPASTRGLLVLKCGKGRGATSRHGRGVLRMGRSTRSAEALIGVIEQRVRAGEPWILQPYVRQRYVVAMGPDPRTCIETPVSARFMVYFGRPPGRDVRLLAGLANFGSHWKVSGQSPSAADSGHRGTAFTEICSLESS